MKKFKEYETTLWLILGFICAIIYTILALEKFMIGALFCVIMSRLSIINNKIEKSNE